MNISVEARRDIVVAAAFVGVVAAMTLTGYLFSLLPSFEEKCAKQCHAPIMEGHMVYIYPATMTAGSSGRGPKECKCFQPGTYNSLQQ
jgi:hypothetical protein